MVLHCEHLSTSTVVHDFEQRTMSSANGASDALGMGPSTGYTLSSMITVLYVLTVLINISYLHAIVFVSDIHMHIYVVTNLLMFYFWIKLTMKMPNFLTCSSCNSLHRLHTFLHLKNKCPPSSSNLPHMIHMVSKVC